MKFIDTVTVNRIFLWLDNSRHAPFDTEAKAIEFLCEKGDVYPLARDIAKHGLNPLERMAIFLTDKRKAAKADAGYSVAEGNRRICAVKLLHDPDLAPANLRKAFEKLAENGLPLTRFLRRCLAQSMTLSSGLILCTTDPKAELGGGNKNKAAQASVLSGSGYGNRCLYFKNINKIKVLWRSGRDSNIVE